MAEVACEPTPERKRSALEEVLRSETLARCDQLKRFLAFVCEEEIAGRGDQLSEYRIGTEALGRSKRYSPNEDSTVRNRAFALRNKLEEYYARENPGAALRIQLPKGSYVPRFVEHTLELEPSPPVPSVAVEPAATIEYRPGKRSRVVMAAFAAGVVAAALLAGILWLLFLRGASHQPVDPAIREVWGPLLNRDANVLVCVATPPHLVIRQYPADAPPPVPRYIEVPPDVARSLQRSRPIPADKGWFMLKTENSPLWGDSMGALAAARVLAHAEASFRVLPERVVTFPILREKNVMIFGIPEYSGAAERLLARARLSIGYSPEAHEQVIWRKKPDGTSSIAHMPARSDKGEQVKTYGLITVLPSDGAEAGHSRTVVISGLNSAGSQAAAEFFCSADSLRGLRSRLRVQGSGEMPKAYQVVVESTATSTLPLSVAYVAHEVIEK